MRRFSSFNRVVALGVFVCFLTTNVQAMPVQEAWLGERGTGNAFGSKDIPSLSLPSSLGSMVETYTAPRSSVLGSRKYGDRVAEAGDPRFVIYIQDAHDSLEAQENIAEMIRWLVKDYGVKTVYEEGYEGPVPTDKLFGQIKDPALKEKISYYLMDKLRVGGAEYAHINRNSRSSVLGPRIQKIRGTGSGDRGTDFDLIGADDINLHLENIRAYEQAAKNRGGVTKDIQRIRKELQKLIDKNFPKEMKEWLSLKARYQNEQLPLVEYLHRIFKDRGPRTGDPKGSAVPVTRSLYKNIEALLSGKESAIKKIDLRTLLAEIKALEDALVESGLPLERDRKTYGYYESVLLLEKLNTLQLSAEEYAALKDSLEGLKTEDVARFIAKESRHSLVLFKAWEDLIADSINFYERAKKRDEAIEKCLNGFSTTRTEDRGPETQEQGVPGLRTPTLEKATVLVFGGFHKEAIKRILKEKGISYVILSPSLGSPSKRHQDYYRMLMEGGKYDFETLSSISKGPKTIDHRPKTHFRGGAQPLLGSGEGYKIKTARPETRSGGSKTCSLNSESSERLSREHNTNLTHSFSHVNKAGRGSPAEDPRVESALPGFEPGSGSSRENRFIQLSYRADQQEDDKSGLSISQEKYDLNKLSPRGNNSASDSEKQGPRTEDPVSSIARQSTCPQRAVAMDYTPIIDLLAEIAAPFRNELRENFILYLDRALTDRPETGDQRPQTLAQTESRSEARQNSKIPDARIHVAISVIPGRPTEEALFRIIKTSLEAGGDAIHFDIRQGRYFKRIQKENQNKTDPDNTRDFNPGFFLRMKASGVPEGSQDLHLLYWEPSQEALLALAKTGMFKSIDVQMNAFGTPERLIKTLKTLHSAGLQAGLVVEAEESVAQIPEEVLSVSDVVLFTAVDTSQTGGLTQKEVLKKARELRKRGFLGQIADQGGINMENIGLARQYGANIFVVGSDIFANKDGLTPREALQKLKIKIRSEIRAEGFEAPAKYKVVFFDIGNVLLRGDRRKTAGILAQYCDKPEDEIAAALESSTSSDKRLYEKGQLSTEEFFRRVKEKLGLSMDYEAFVRAYTEKFSVIEENAEVLKRLKAAGYKIGIISEIGRMSKDYVRAAFSDIFGKADYFVASCDAGMMKDDPAIFDMALKDAGFPAGEAVFIDDLEKNIGVATGRGMTGVQFISGQTDLFSSLKNILERSGARQRSAAHTAHDPKDEKLLEAGREINFQFVIDGYEGLRQKLEAMVQTDPDKKAEPAPFPGGGTILFEKKAPGFTVTLNTEGRSTLADFLQSLRNLEPAIGQQTVLLIDYVRYSDNPRGMPLRENHSILIREPGLVQEAPRKKGSGKNDGEDQRSGKEESRASRLDPFGAEDDDANAADPGDQAAGDDDAFTAGVEDSATLDGEDIASDELEAVLEGGTNDGQGESETAAVYRALGEEKSGRKERVRGGQQAPVTSPDAPLKQIRLLYMKMLGAGNELDDEKLFKQAYAIIDWLDANAGFLKERPGLLPPDWLSMFKEKFELYATQLDVAATGDAKAVFAEIDRVARQMPFIAAPSVKPAASPTRALVVSPPARASAPQRSRKAKAPPVSSPRKPEAPPAARAFQILAKPRVLAVAPVSKKQGAPTVVAAPAPEPVPSAAPLPQTAPVDAAQARQDRLARLARDAGVSPEKITPVRWLILTVFQRRMIELRYGLTGEPPMSFTEVAARLNAEKVPHDNTKGGFFQSGNLYVAMKKTLQLFGQYEDGWAWLAADTGVTVKVLQQNMPKLSPAEAASICWKYGIETQRVDSNPRIIELLRERKIDGSRGHPVESPGVVIYLENKARERLSTTFPAARSVAGSLPPRTEALVEGAGSGTPAAKKHSHGDYSDILAQPDEFAARLTPATRAVFNAIKTLAMPFSHHDIVTQTGKTATAVNFQIVMIRKEIDALGLAAAPVTAAGTEVARSVVRQVAWLAPVAPGWAGLAEALSATENAAKERFWTLLPKHQFVMERRHGLGREILSDEQIAAELSAEFGILADVARIREIDREALAKMQDQGISAGAVAGAPASPPAKTAPAPGKIHGGTPEKKQEAKAPSRKARTESVLALLDQLAPGRQRPASAAPVQSEPVVKKQTSATPLLQTAPVIQTHIPAPFPGRPAIESPRPQPPNPPAVLLVGPVAVPISETTKGPAVLTAPRQVPVVPEPVAVKDILTTFVPPPQTLPPSSEKTVEKSSVVITAPPAQPARPTRPHEELVLRVRAARDETAKIAAIRRAVEILIHEMNIAKSHPDAGTLKGLEDLFLEALAEKTELGKMWSREETEWGERILRERSQSLRAKIDAARTVKDTEGEIASLAEFRAFIQQKLLLDHKPTGEEMPYANVAAEFMSDPGPEARSEMRSNLRAESDSKAGTVRAETRNPHQHPVFLGFQTPGVYKGDGPPEVRGSPSNKSSGSLAALEVLKQKMPRKLQPSLRRIEASIREKKWDRAAHDFRNFLTIASVFTPPGIPASKLKSMFATFEKSLARKRSEERSELRAKRNEVPVRAEMHLLPVASRTSRDSLEARSEMHQNPVGFGTSSALPGSARSEMRRDIHSPARTRAGTKEVPAEMREPMLSDTAAHELFVRVQEKLFGKGELTELEVYSELGLDVTYEAEKVTPKNHYAGVVRFGPLIFVIVPTADIFGILAAMWQFRRKLGPLYEQYRDNILFAFPSVYRVAESMDEQNPISLHALRAIHGMLARRDTIRGATVHVTGGAGGILAGVALKLGAKHVISTEKEFWWTVIGRWLAFLQGWSRYDPKTGKGQISFINKDIASPAFEKEVRRYRMDETVDVAVANLGFWNTYGNANDKAAEFATNWKNVKLFINSGFYSTTLAVSPGEAQQRPRVEALRKRLQENGFQATVFGNEPTSSKSLGEKIHETRVLALIASRSEMRKTPGTVLEEGRTVPENVRSEARLQDENIISKEEFRKTPYAKWEPWLRAIDFAAALVLMPALMAVTAVLAPLIYFSSPGPVFYAQMRPGYKQKLFKMYKFRTMPVTGDRTPTQLGEFLRRTLLDEFPQILNVLKGEMSLVGPRPLIEKDIAIYPPYGEIFETRKPGGFSLHMRRRGFGKGTPTFEELKRAVELNAYEIRRWSPGMIFRIVGGTVKDVLMSMVSFPTHTPGTHKDEETAMTEAPEAARKAETVAQLKAVVFDIGGVVVDNSLEKIAQDFIDLGVRGKTIPEIIQICFYSDFYKAFELDPRITAAAEFHAALCGALGLASLTFDRFVEIWTGGMKPKAETVELILREKAAGQKIFFLSDTNRLHMEYMRDRYPEVYGLADHVFTSYKLGLRKGDGSEIFREMGRKVERDPQYGFKLGEMLFFDDREFNVNGALTAGLPAHVFTGARAAALEIHRRTSVRSEVRADPRGSVPQRGQANFLEFEGTRYSFETLRHMLQTPDQLAQGILLLKTLDLEKREPFMQTLPEELRARVWSLLNRPARPLTEALRGRFLQNGEYMARFEGSLYLGIGKDTEGAYVHFEVRPVSRTKATFRILEMGHEADEYSVEIGSAEEDDSTYMVASEQIKEEKLHAMELFVVKDPFITRGKHFSFRLFQKDGGLWFKVVDYDSRNGTNISTEIYPRTVAYPQRQEVLESFQAELDRITEQDLQPGEMWTDKREDPETLARFKQMLDQAANLYLASAEFPELRAKRKEILKDFFVANTAGLSSARQDCAFAWLEAFRDDERVSVSELAFEVAIDYVFLWGKLEKLLESEKILSLPVWLHRKMLQVFTKKANLEKSRTGDLATSNPSKTMKMVTADIRAMLIETQRKKSSRTSPAIPDKNKTSGGLRSEAHQNPVGFGTSSALPGRARSEMREAGIDVQTLELGWGGLLDEEIMDGRAVNARNFILRNLSGWAGEKAAPRGLNLGAGPGGFSREVQQTVRGFVTDVDRVRPAEHWQREAQFTQADAQALPFKEGSEDFIVSTFLMNYVDRDKFAGEMMKALKPGGRAALILHHPQSLFFSEGFFDKRTRPLSEQIRDLEDLLLWLQRIQSALEGPVDRSNLAELAPPSQYSNEITLPDHISNFFKLASAKIAEGSLISILKNAAVKDITRLQGLLRMRLLHASKPALFTNTDEIRSFFESKGFRVETVEEITTHSGALYAFGVILDKPSSRSEARGKETGERGTGNDERQNSFVGRSPSSVPPGEAVRFEMNQNLARRTFGNEVRVAPDRSEIDGGIPVLKAMPTLSETGMDPRIEEALAGIYGHKRYKLPLREMLRLFENFEAMKGLRIVELGVPGFEGSPSLEALRKKGLNARGVGEGAMGSDYVVRDLFDRFLSRPGTENSLDVVYSTLSVYPKTGARDPSEILDPVSMDRWGHPAVQALIAKSLKPGGIWINVIARIEHAYRLSDEEIRLLGFEKVRESQTEEKYSHGFIVTVLRKRETPAASFGAVRSEIREKVAVEPAEKNEARQAADTWAGNVPLLGAGFAGWDFTRGELYAIAGGAVVAYMAYNFLTYWLETRAKRRGRNVDIGMLLAILNLGKKLDLEMALFLIKMLETRVIENTALRPGAAIALGMLLRSGRLSAEVKDAALAALREAVEKDKFWPVRKEAAEALGRQGDVLSVPVLQKAAKAKADGVRRAAYFALGEIGARLTTGQNEERVAVKVSLVRGGKDPVDFIRSAAIEGFGKLEGTVPLFSDPQASRKPLTLKTKAQTTPSSGEVRKIPGTVLEKRRTVPENVRSERQTPIVAARPLSDASPIRPEMKQTVRTAIENLKGKFTVVTDMADVAEFTAKQLEEFEVMAHLQPNVKFVFCNSQGRFLNVQAGKGQEPSLRITQLQAELGADRIVITESEIENLAMNKGEKVIRIAKGNGERETGNANKKIFQFRYVADETGLVPMALLYADQHEKPSEKGMMDLSMVRAELRMAIQEFQNSIVFARAA